MFDQSHTPDPIAAAALVQVRAALGQMDDMLSTENWQALRAHLQAAAALLGVLAPVETAKEAAQ